ncbi:MAG TPA: citrate/2-methylcitrate synthase [Acetobacteraceae bacterium]|jgi:citrate synthase|nr:citrate/2-methylcitrate synthase [Acetobacteraceae bacterium]
MQPGLEGVVAAETVLSMADPKRNMLWMRGVAVPDLVVDFGYEGTIALLWEGFAGDGLTRAGVRDALGVARVAAFAALPAWLDGAARRSMDAAVRRCLAELADDSTPVAIIGALSVGVPALLRARRGDAPVAPDASLGTAADLLRMTHGRVQDAARVAALDAYYTVMMDSGLNASSFTSRVVASTRASLVSAALGAWCAFTGALHGGAPGPTLDLLDEAAGVADLDAWLERKLVAGERLMGFGHRLFPDGNDPRSQAIRVALRRLGPQASRLEFANEVERRLQSVLARVKPGRRLPANLEIAAALLLDALEFPRDAFTAVFAVGRGPGWLAQAMEQAKTGRMYRPTATYVGPPVGV